jgi:hypothetical protein
MMSDFPTNEQLRYLLELDRLLKERHGLPGNHPMRRQVKLLQTVWDSEILQRVMNAVKRLEAERVRAYYLGERIPSPEDFCGDLTLGHAVDASGRTDPVAFNSDRFTGHGIVCGLPGHGKSYLCRLLLMLIAKRLPWMRILVYDPNQTYREMVTREPGTWLWLPWEKCRLNCLVPPKGFPYALWGPSAIDVLTRGELAHSRYVLARAVEHLYAEAHLPEYDDGISPVPSLFDLCDYLARHRRLFGVKDSYIQSALTVLSGRLDTTGSVYDCARGMESVLTNSRVCISTQNCSPLETYRAFINGLNHYAYWQCSMEPLLDPPELHTLIVVEESQVLLERRGDASIGFHLEMLLRSRALGIGFLFVAQDISHIDTGILAGINNYFCFTQGTRGNKELVQKMLDLSPRETALLSELPVGMCFARVMGDTKFPYPFLLQVEDLS